MQLAVLSGTVLEKSVSTVMEMFGLGQNTVIIRTLTIRPELRYILEKLNNRLITGQVKEIIESHQSEMLLRDRVLIFVPFLDQGDLIAKGLGCEFYHGGSDLNDEQ